MSSSNKLSIIKISLRRVFSMAVILLLTVFTSQPLHAEEPSVVKPDTIGAFRGNIVETSKTGGVQNKQDDLGSMVGTIVSSLLSLLGILLVCYLVYGGYLWMTAQGSDDNIKRAKSIIRDAIIGLVIIFSSWVIASFIFGLLAQGTAAPNTGSLGTDCTATPCAQDCPVQACLDAAPSN